MTVGVDPTYDPQNPGPEDVQNDPTQEPLAVDPAYVNSLVSKTAPAYPTDKIISLIRAGKPGPAPVAPRPGFLDRLAAGLANVQSPGGEGHAGDVFGANLLAGAARSFGGARVAGRAADLKAQMDQYNSDTAEKQAESRAGITGLTTDYATRSKLAEDAANHPMKGPSTDHVVTADDAKLNPRLKGLVGQPMSRSQYQSVITEKPDAAATDSPLSNDAIDALVQLKLQGGTDPTFGMGKAGVGNKVRFYNRLGEIVKAGGLDVGTRIAQAKAERESLTQLTQTHTAASAYGDNVERNLKILEPTLKHLPDTGLTPFNALLRPAASAIGNTNMSAFNTARQIVVPEFARILNSPTLKGVISDSARKEIQTIIDPNATVGQIKRSIQILRTDKNNRLAAYSDAIRQSQQRIKALGVLPGAAPSGLDRAFAPKGPVVNWVRDPATGKLVRQ